MSSLVYLSYLRFKGSIRNIFTHVGSAIITFIAILFFAFIIVSMISNREILSQIAVVNDMSMFVMMIIGILVAFIGIMLFQPRHALFYKQDAMYLFAGPFSKKHVLGYLILQTSTQSITYGCMVVLYALCFGLGLSPSIGFLLLSLLFSILVTHFLLVLVDFFYLTQITNPKTKIAKYIFGGIVLLIVAALFAKNFLASGGDVIVAFKAFMVDPLFYFIPLFGWMKYGLVSFVANDILGVMIGLLLVSVACIVLSYVVVSYKGDFYETAIDDAEWASNVRAKAKTGKTVYDENRKIHAIKNVTFKEGAGALFSKNLLELRKTNGWIKISEVALLLFYLAIAYFIGMDYTFYQYYILVIIMTTANNDYIISELKKQYVYLIPDAPFKKLVNLILPLLLKMLFVVVFGLTAGFIVYQPNILVYITSIINIFGYAVMFVAGSVWSIRLLKSGSNMVAEQFIKMGVVLVATIPAIVITVAVTLMGANSGIDTNKIFMVAQIASMVCNLGVGFLFLVSAKGMLKGANVMAD